MTSEMKLIHHNIVASKVFLYHSLMQKPVNVLSDWDFDMLTTLARDKDVQEVLNGA